MISFKIVLEIVRTFLIVNTIAKLLIVSAEKPIKTPTLIKKQYTGCTAKDDFKSDEDDCTIFHRCAYGYQYTYACPPNNGFDSAQKVCNFRMYVPECQVTQTETPEVTPNSDANSNNKKQSLNTPPIGLIQVPIPTTNVCTLTLTEFEREIFCKSATFKLYYGPCCE